MENDLFESKLESIYKDYNVLKENDLVKRNPKLLLGKEQQLKQFDILVENRKSLSINQVQCLNEDLDKVGKELKDLRKGMRL